MGLATGAAHAVSGTGLLGVSAPDGLLVVATSIPAGLSYRADYPVTYFGLGTVTPGSALGWSASVELLKAAEVIYPLVPDCSHVGYELPSGVAVTITELAASGMGGGGGVVTGIAAVKLDYQLASDISNVALVAGAWTDVVADQNVVVGADTSSLLVAVNMALHLHATAALNFATRLVVDSGGGQKAYPLGGTSLGQALDVAIPGGWWDVGILGAGTHRLKVQYMSSSTSGSIYVRGSSLQQYEHLGIQATEIS